MSGVSIISALLADHSALLAVVPVGQIKAGKFPDGIAPPSLLIRHVSTVEQQMLRRSEVVHTVERIAVTVRCAQYRQVGAILELVRKACAGKTGGIGGFANVAVLTAGTGPDVNGPAHTFERTQDLRVSFDAPA